jgi:drug/metabolite transporter (DMT)-like permease
MSVGPVAPAALGRARLEVLAAALLFSTGGAAIKGTALAAVQVAGLRSGVAALTLLLVLPAARRGFRLDLLPAALAYAGTLVCFVTATKMTTAAAAIFLQSTAPLWVLLLSPWLLGEPIRRRDIPFIGAVIVGLAMVFWGSRDPAATAPQPALGNAIALASGLFYALLMILFRRLARDRATADRSIPATVLGNALACLLCLPFALPLAEVRPADGIAIVYLGTVQIGLAYWLFTRGLAHLTALEVSLLVLLEPVLNPLWTWWLHDERPSPLALAGGAVLLAAIAVRTLLDRNRT